MFVDYFTYYVLCTDQNYIYALFPVLPTNLYFMGRQEVVKAQAINTCMLKCISHKRFREQLSGCCIKVLTVLLEYFCDFQNLYELDKLSNITKGARWVGDKQTSE